jgi:hypothetical protein
LFIGFPDFENSKIRDLYCWGAYLLYEPINILKKNSQVIKSSILEEIFYIWITKKLYMKKFIMAIALSMVAFGSFAQEEEDYAQEVPEIPVDMQFNKTLYSMNEGNMFMSMEPVAFVLAVVLPATYEQAKSEIFGGTPDPELKDVKTGESKEAGKTFAYQTANVKSTDGKDLAMEIYIVKYDEVTSIMVSGAYDVKAKAVFEKETKKAALSAKPAQ